MIYLYWDDDKLSALRVGTKTANKQITTMKTKTKKGKKKY